MSASFVHAPSTRFGGSWRLRPVASSGTSGVAETKIATAHADWSISALWVFLASYVVFAGVTWLVYLRTSIADHRVPVLAEAAA